MKVKISLVILVLISGVFAWKHFFQRRKPTTTVRSPLIVKSDESPGEVPLQSTPNIQPKLRLKNEEFGYDESVSADGQVIDRPEPNLLESKAERKKLRQQNQTERDSSSSAPRLDVDYN